MSRWRAAGRLLTDEQDGRIRGGLGGGEQRRRGRGGVELHGGAGLLVTRGRESGGRGQSLLGHLDGTHTDTVDADRKGRRGGRGHRTQHRTDTASTTATQHTTTAEQLTATLTWQCELVCGWQDGCARDSCGMTHHPALPAMAVERSDAGSSSLSNGG